MGVFEGTALIARQPYHAGWLLPGGDQRGAATYYPTGPIRGGIVIARLAEFPQQSRLGESVPGLHKTHLAHVAIATAINVLHLISWLRGEPPVQTRTSPFKRVMKPAV